VKSPTVIEREIIIIQPTNPQVIFIPRYDPVTVIVVHQRPASVITFGTGLAFGAWMGYTMSWNSRTIRVDVRHRNYWAVVRPGWGVVNHWRPSSVGGVARRTSRRTARRTTRRLDRRHAAPAGAPALGRPAAGGGRRPGAGADTGARAGARGGALSGAAAGRGTGGPAPGQRIGDRPSAVGRGPTAPAGRPSRPFGGYGPGRATQRQSERGAISRGQRPSTGGRREAMDERRPRR
jgi:hypothetical protein